MALADGNVIDKKLTDLYADKVTVNVNRIPEVHPDTVWQIMQMVATTNKALVKINFL